MQKLGYTPTNTWLHLAQCQFFSTRPTVTALINLSMDVHRNVALSKGKGEEGRKAGTPLSG